MCAHVAHLSVYRHSCLLQWTYLQLIFKSRWTITVTLGVPVNLTLNVVIQINYLIVSSLFRNLAIW